jgi:SAM-dependent methyltransferase
MLRIYRPQNLFQLANVTSLNRYPELFAFAQEALRGVARPQLLSLGCATGEEVFSLRDYFFDAVITGLDINSANIRICRQRLRRRPDPNIAFRRAGTVAGEETGAFDAIFCLSVLRHGALRAAGTTRCDHLLKFSNFERTIADLTRCLRPGGYLFIVNSNFRLSDTKSAEEFEVVLQKPELGYDHRTPIFGADNLLLRQAGYDPCGFRKTCRPNPDADDPAPIAAMHPGWGAAGTSTPAE